MKQGRYTSINSEEFRRSNLARVNFGKVCFGCEKRHVGCHATCEAYIECKAAYEKEKEELKRKRSNAYIANLKPYTY